MTRYRRIGNINQTVVDGEIFVILPGGAEMFHLDQMAAGLWRVLEGPTSREELVALFQAAFPDTDQETIEKDIAAALERMLANGLVHAVDADETPES